MEIAQILQQRATTHGNYKDVTHFYRQFMKILSNNSANLTDEQYMALSMIFGKTARILAGNPDFDDHWKDIAGYATLVANSLENEQ